MADVDERDYWVPEHVREYLRQLGFVLPLEPMEEYIRDWHGWMESRGTFYDYKDTDAVGRVYEVHRRSIHPAMRVCREWGSLLLNDKTQVVCGEQACTDWLSSFFTRTGFFPAAQATVVRSFGMGTGAWALWIDAGKGDFRIRRYDARMVIPLTWDEEGVTECAFVTRVFWRGKAVDQLQMHLMCGLDDDSRASDSISDADLSEGFSLSQATNTEARKSSGPSPSNSDTTCDSADGGRSYKIVTVCFDDEGNEVDVDGVCREYDTGCPFPTFAIVRPAIENTRIDMSPYGQSVFADAVDVIQAVDLAFDALINEVDVSKMRVFLSDVLFDREQDGKKGKPISIPFGKQDCTVFRKVMSSEDMIQQFAPALRTKDQAEAFRIALRMLGDLCGLGIAYFDYGNTGRSGYMKTATEVSSSNAALMRNIARHEHVLEQAIAGISRVLLFFARKFGEGLPDEGDIRVIFDDSIIVDTAAEKMQDMAEVNVTMQPWEYRKKWYGEDDKTAKAHAKDIGGTWRS